MIPFFYTMKAPIGDISLNYNAIFPDNLSSENIVLLFLHEALGSIGQWKDFPEKLCDVLQLQGIVYERQGHGESSSFNSERDHRYLHDYALNELPKFIESVIPGKKLILVGHSDGGSIALLYAHQYPENIEAIVTMAAHVINEPETVAGIAPAISAFEKGKLDGLRKYHGDKTDQLFYAWANTWRSESFETWNICEEIGSENIPGLFLQGANDQYGTEKQLQLIKNRFADPSTYVLIDDCGHHPHLEKTEQVIAMIRKWILDYVSIS